MKPNSLAPRDAESNARFRASLWNECSDKNTAAWVKESCRQDILFFFNAFLWAEDPFAEKGLRHGIPRSRLRPIITYPFQDEFILDLQGAIDVGEDIVADKSRDMLATYMVLGVFLHGWLFRGHKYLISSWKEDEIDGKEDTSTHFGKLRFFLNHLPHWLLPKGFDRKRNSSSMKLQNPENGGTLTGSAASANLGSGRREDAIFFDELSKWLDSSNEAWTSASDATHCKIAVWTPRGSGNKAAELIRGEEVKRKHHLFWHLHPEKRYTSLEHARAVAAGGVFDKVGKYTVQAHADQKKAPSGCYIDQHGKIRSEWYDNECKKRKEDDIKENLDCSYLTSGRNVFDTLKCQENLYKATPPKLIGNLTYKVKPEYDINGLCINQEDLRVEFFPNVNGMLKIWEEPPTESRWENAYIVSADVAEGLEQGDYDSATVLKRLDVDKPTTVATFHGHIKPHEYAEELVKLAVYYDRAYIAPERNSIGLAVINQMYQTYNKIYHKEVMTKGYPEMKDKMGFETNRMTKPIVIENLSKLIANNELVDPDEGFWQETLTYVNDDGELGAQGKRRGEKCFDDRVMDRAILFWIHSQLPAPSQKRNVRVFDGIGREVRTERHNDPHSLVTWL